MALKSLHYKAPIQGQSEVNGTDVTQLHAKRLINFIPEHNHKVRRRPPVILKCTDLMNSAANVTTDVKAVRVRHSDSSQWSIVFARTLGGAVSATAHTIDQPECTVAPVVITDDAQSYLNAAGSLSGDLEGKTLAGTSYIWNRNVNTANITEATTPVYDPAIVPANHTPYAIVDLDCLTGPFKTFDTLGFNGIGQTATWILNPRRSFTVNHTVTYDGGRGVEIGTLNYMGTVVQIDDYELPVGVLNTPLIGGYDPGSVLNEIQDRFQAPGQDRVEYLLDTTDAARMVISGLGNRNPANAVATAFQFLGDDSAVTPKAYGGINITSPMRTGEFFWGTDSRYLVISRPDGATPENIVSSSFEMYTGFQGNTQIISGNTFMAPAVPDDPPTRLTTRVAVGDDPDGLQDNGINTSLLNPIITNAEIPYSPLDVANFAALPPSAPTFLTFTTLDNGNTYAFDPNVGGSGTWVLQATPGGLRGLDRRLMPVGATFDGTTWTIDILDWQERSLAADPELIPDPDFIGKAIRDLSLFRGRLAMLYRDGIALSSAEDDLGFYPLSELTITDGDPIYLTNTLAEDTTFHWLVPFNRRLLVMAEDAVLELIASSGLLTVESVELRNLTEHPVSDSIRPYAVSGLLFFGTDTGENQIDISEFSIGRTSTTSLTETAIADTSTLLNPKLIRGDQFSVATIPALFASIYCPREGSVAYYHTFRQIQGQRTQNAFAEVHLPTGFTLISMVPFKDTIGVHYLDAVGAVQYGVMEFSALSTGLGTLTNIYSDGQVVNAPAVLAGANTTITLPHVFDETETAISVVSQGPPDPTGLNVAEGYLATVVSRTATTVTVKGDWTTQDFVVGADCPQSQWHLPDPFVFVSRDRSDRVPQLSTEAVAQKGVIGLIDCGGVVMTSQTQTVFNFEQDSFGLDDSSFDSASLFTGSDLFLVGERLKGLTLVVGSSNHRPLELNFVTLHVRSFGRA